jgi:ABC-type bacteriocin/lantibiotic exporter with double-glycine peptidase domain
MIDAVAGRLEALAPMSGCRARAFLKDAPILLLDEVTSNVDSLNEALIQRAITRLAVECTVLMIAHHLQTVKSADNILVFKQGRLWKAAVIKSFWRVAGCTTNCGRRR